ncbi:MAG TPA: acyltransferase [Tepidisphaeraceae bacterium]|jgi:peptidoglycan/LPS O-acetylase OafA/YrhL
MAITSSAPDYDSYIKTRYFPALDGLRCISIVAVILFHLYHNQYRIAAHGNMGVWLFFAISGFLITTLLLRERSANGRISLRKFYMRRSLRIFPLYYAVVCLYVILTLLVQRHTQQGREFFHHVPYYLTYTSNWFVTLAGAQGVTFYFAWSLATEEQFYLAWPWIIRFTRRWYLPVVFIFFLIGLKFLIGDLESRGLIDPQALLPRIIMSIAYPICVGCIVAFVLHNRHGFAIARRIIGWFGADLTIAVIIGISIYFLNESLMLAIWMVALVAAVCIHPQNIFARLMSFRPVRYIGQISYGMYLLHMMCMQITRGIQTRFRVPTQYVWIIEIGLAIGVASASYWTFERWFLKLKERFSARPAKKQDVAIIAEPVVAERT